MKFLIGCIKDILVLLFEIVVYFLGVVPATIFINVWEKYFETEEEKER